MGLNSPGFVSSNAAGSTDRTRAPGPDGKRRNEGLELVVFGALVTVALFFDTTAAVLALPVPRYLGAEACVKVRMALVMAVSMVGPVLAINRGSPFMVAFMRAAVFVLGGMLPDTPSAWVALSCPSWAVWPAVAVKCYLWVVSLRTGRALQELRRAHSSS